MKLRVLWIWHHLHLGPSSIFSARHCPAVSTCTLAYCHSARFGSLPMCLSHADGFSDQMGRGPNAALQRFKSRENAAGGVLKTCGANATRWKGSEHRKQ
eukprot:1216427-Amphidinium_carterae.1